MVQQGVIRKVFHNQSNAKPFVMKYPHSGICLNCNICECKTAKKIPYVTDICRNYEIANYTKMAQTV